MSTATATTRSPKAGSVIAKVRDYLTSGRSLTHAEAFTNFGTMRLASAIEELRNKYGYGTRLVTTIKDNIVTGKKYASYTLSKEIVAGARVEVVSVKASKKLELCCGTEYFKPGETGVVDAVGSEDVSVRMDNGNDWYIAPADLKVIG